MKSSLRGLDWVNFFLADVQSGVGFLFLSGVALAALAILYFFMPETHEHRNGRQC